MELKNTTVNNVISTTIQNRKLLYRFLKDTPREVLLNIPEGYRNNIWWNIAHTMVTQQMLVYNLSKLPMRVEKDVVNKFKMGTVPDGTATENEIEKVAAYLFSTMEWTQEDYEKGLFKEFDPYTTRTKVILRNVEDALNYNLYHEGLHLGVILSLLKVVR